MPTFAANAYSNVRVVQWAHMSKGTNQESRKCDDLSMKRISICTLTGMRVREETMLAGVSRYGFRDETDGLSGKIWTSFTFLWMGGGSLVVPSLGGVPPAARSASRRHDGRGIALTPRRAVGRLLVIQ